MDNVSGVLIRFKDQFLTFTNVPRLIYHCFGRLPGCPVTYWPSLLNYGDEFVQDLHLFPFSPEPIYYYFFDCSDT